MNKTARNLAMAMAALATLAACGGGTPDLPGSPTPPDSGDTPYQPGSGDTPSQPSQPGSGDTGGSATRPDMSDPHYETTLGLGYDQSTEVSSLAMINRDGPDQRTGRLALVPAGSQKHGYMYDSDTVELGVDEASGFIDRAEHYVYAAMGDEFIDQGFTTVGTATLGDGREMLILEHEFTGRRFYMPADGSPVRVGAFSTSYDDDEVVAHSVFGLETGISDLARQTGSGSFSGISEASVVGGSVAGNFRGTSEGTLNFDTGDFTVFADMSSDAGDGISVTSTGVMTDAGELQSVMVADGLLSDGGRVDGVFDGQIFGSNADDIGGTFSGGNGSTSIAGQMLMSR